MVNTLDLDSRLLGIQWLVYSCEETGPYAGCNALTDATNFYLDGNAAPASTLDPSTASLVCESCNADELSLKPHVSQVYRGNLTGYITDGFCLDQTSCWQQQLRQGVPYEQTLQTQHSFGIRTAAYNWRANTQAYPFDV